MRRSEPRAEASLMQKRTSHAEGPRLAWKRLNAETIGLLNREIENVISSER